MVIIMMGGNINSKATGSVFILVGAAVGAGALALPLLAGRVGAIYSVLLMLGVFFIITVTALMILEVCLALKIYRNSFSSMAKATLGPFGKLVVEIVIFLLLYALMSAYISGSGALLTTFLEYFFHLNTIPNWFNVSLFTVVFGSIIYYSSRAVDLSCRILVPIKVIVFLLLVILLVPKMHFDYLYESNAKPLWVIVPVFLVSFGFHPVIPSIVSYMGEQSKVLPKVLIVSAFIIFVIYFLWIISVLGTIPPRGSHSFHALIKNNGSIGTMVVYINELVHSNIIRSSVSLFSGTSILISFLGTGIGLFDLAADTFNRPNTRSGRFSTVLLAFLVPLGFAIFYPNGFILALHYAAIFFTVLGIILPPIMVFRLRRNSDLSSNYRVFGGNTLLLLVFSVGIVLVILEILNIFKGC